MGLAALLAVEIRSAGDPQDKTKKSHALRWDPPRVDIPLQSVSADPPCSLPDVLQMAGQRGEELVGHLQNFIAHEQIRYEQTASLGMATQTGITGMGALPGQAADMFFTGKFDYVVDFGKKSEPIQVHEHRTPLKGTDDRNLGAMVSQGLPALALIFYPALQSDYEIRCEGFTTWKNQPAWVVHFSQKKGKRPRTVTIWTHSESRPLDRSAMEMLPLSIKGRAWLRADSGQVMHLETNLVERLPRIGLEESALSVDYAAIKFKTQNVEVWLPQFAVGYTDYSERRMVVEHTFSDFQLFSVQTEDVIQSPREP